METTLPAAAGAELKQYVLITNATVPELISSLFRLCTTQPYSFIGLLELISGKQAQMKPRDASSSERTETERKDQLYGH